MAAKTYEQYCAVARALDVVGDRWTLLVVRELLTGPKRNTDLRDGLPGIATNLLSDRLRALRGGGLVERAALPPPAPANVYRLTARGRALEPVVLALAHWGLPDLGEPRPADAYRLRWLALTLQDRFNPAAMHTEEEAYELRVDHEVVVVRTRPGGAEVHDGPSPTAVDGTLEAPRDLFLAWGTGRLDDAAARARGLRGVPQSTPARLRELFPIPDGRKQAD